MTVSPSASYAFSVGQTVIVRDGLGHSSFSPVVSYDRLTGVLVLGVSDYVDLGFSYILNASSYSINLSGKVGRQGADGLDGVTGATGWTGATGETGATGVTGTIIFSGSVDMNDGGIPIAPPWAPYAGRVGDFFINTADGYLYLRTA
jgi:hypothetical protein